MQNKEIKKIYKTILDIIKSTKDYCEIKISDNKFLFRNRQNPNQTLSIFLTEDELLNMKNGIYNEKTKYLKELEYICKIKEYETIEPFKNETERVIFINSLKSLGQNSIKKNLLNLLKDIIDSLKFYSKMEEKTQDRYAATQFTCGCIGILLTFILLMEKYTVYAIVSFIFGITPTLVVVGNNFVKDRIKRISEYRERKLLIESNSVNIESLSCSMKNYYPYLSEEHSKGSFLENSSVNQNNNQDETILSDPILNEIYKLLNILSNSNLCKEIVGVFLTKINEIKEEYISKNNNVNESRITIENRFSIQQVMIQKLSILEYELINMIKERRNELIASKELDIINRKIYQIENKNKYVR